MLLSFSIIFLMLSPQCRVLHSTIAVTSKQTSDELTLLSVTI